jgi:hypothetical protein
MVMETAPVVAGWDPASGLGLVVAGWDPASGLGLVVVDLGREVVDLGLVEVAEVVDLGLEVVAGKVLDLEAWAGEVRAAGADVA